MNKDMSKTVNKTMTKNYQTLSRQTFTQWIAGAMAILALPLQASASSDASASDVSAALNSTTPSVVKTSELGNSIQALSRVASIYATVGFGTTPNITRYRDGVPTGQVDMISGVPVGLGSSYTLSPCTEVGVSYTTLVSALPIDTTSHSVKETQRIQMLLAHFDVRPFETARNFYAGALAGASIYKGIVATNIGLDSGVQAVYFVAGARTGLDFEIMDHFTLGPELRAVLSAGGIEKSFFSGNAVLRFSF